MPQKVPLTELNVAIQSAVQQVLAKHGAVPIDQIWVGFVAPEAVANQATANKLASAIAHGAPGVAEGSVQAFQQAGQADAKLVRHIIGLIYKPPYES